MVPSGWRHGVDVMPSVSGRRIELLCGRRRATRKRVLLAASMCTLDGSFSVLVEDISSTGAKLRGHTFPPTAVEVMIRVGELEMLACIAWSTWQQCGIKFEPPLPDEAIQLLQEQGQWAT